MERLYSGKISHSWEMIGLSLDILKKDLLLDEG